MAASFINNNKTPQLSFKNYPEKSLSPNKAFQVNQSRPARGGGRTGKEGQAGLGSKSC